MSVAKLRWYAARLAAMSPPEILHRVREAALKKAWSADKRGWQAFEAAGAARPRALPEIRRRLACAAGDADHALERLLAGRYCGLGQVVDAHLGPALWFYDPVSATSWPGAERYCFDIDVRSTGVGKGDVKYVWEINRLQMLHPLAAAIARTPDAALIQTALEIVRSWAAANPPFRGVNWVSGIELAMRLVSLTLLIAACPDEHLTQQDHALLARMVAAHAYWLHRYPSKYSSANNHLVAEGLGLFLAGALYPDAAHASDYLAEGRAILEGEALRQIHPDGVGAEQSPTYQAFTMEMIGFAGVVGAALGVPLNDAVQERMRAGALFLRAMMDDAGHCPGIGDNDEGRVIAAPPDREPRYVASVVAALAGWLGDPSLAPPSRDPHLRDGLFASPDATASGKPGLTLFRQGGYSIARSHVAGQNAVLCFDHGPVGYLSLAAHGHADTLAVWLSIGDQQVIVDAGTYLYHSGGALRNRLRSSLAHNTLSVAGASSSRPSSAFSWATRAEGNLLEVTEGDWWRVRAAHAGYRRSHGVTHQREVTREPTGFAVTDRLVGADRPVPVQIGFLIHPELEVTPEANRFHISAGGRPLLRIDGPLTLNPLIVREDLSAGMGLYSPTFGDLVVARQIVFAGEMTEEPVITRLVITST